MPSLAVKAKPKPAKAGARLYLDVLRLVKLGRATNTKIRKSLGVKHPDTVRKITMGMWSLGLIYPLEWVTLPSSHYWSAVWRMGPGDAAPHPEHGDFRPPRCTSIELLAFAAWWNELESPSSMRDLVQATGFGAGTCRQLTAHARAKKMIHVADLSAPPAVGDYAPLFQRGGGADAEKPACRSANETAAIHNERRRQRERSLALHSAVTGAHASALKFNTAGKPA